jgi:hypothetical protein
VAKKQLLKSISEAFAKHADYLGMTLEQAQSHFSTQSSKTPELLSMSVDYVHLIDQLPPLRSSLAEVTAPIERLTALKAEFNALRIHTNQ